MLASADLLLPTFLIHDRTLNLMKNQRDSHFTHLTSPQIFHQSLSPPSVSGLTIAGPSQRFSEAESICGTTQIADNFTAITMANFRDWCCKNQAYARESWWFVANHSHKASGTAVKTWYIAHVPPHLLFSWMNEFLFFPSKSKPNVILGESPFHGTGSTILDAAPQQCRGVSLILMIGGVEMRAAAFG
ncbi:hypothetical protein EI94DRAFT_1704189 [Lactarius quietus]|nr:hypothetical protein EI94DRAFT_1704189 [Lactarius quietus]